MKFAVVYLSLFSTSALAIFQVDTVTLPALTCEPVLIQWQGGERPWTLVIKKDDGSLVQNVGSFDGPTSFQWPAAVEAGTAVFAQVQDATGRVATNDAFVVNPGKETDCLLQLIASTSSSDGSIAGLRPTISASVVPPSLSSSASQSLPSSTILTSSSTLISSTASAGSSLTGLGEIPTSGPAENSSIPSGGVIPTTASSGSTSSASTIPPTTPSSTRKISRAGLAFAILVPCLILLLILGLLLRHRRRRRIGAMSALEAQPHWFDQELYRGRPSSPPDAEQQSTTRNIARIGRPQLSIVPPAVVRSPDTAEITATGGTPVTVTELSSALHLYGQPFAIASSSERYLKGLHSQIDALRAENRRLASLATSPDDNVPPPAYS
ncbi:hypothetical protein R3P38DRAFT_176812 [Favolaschia claudopus]|uniref:Uncharacterized protein n=1 Tax=Favolaschia claudopus TaxID=2862362 RepID=A0AAW0D1B3_9AGAR